MGSRWVAAALGAHREAYAQYARALRFAGGLDSRTVAEAAPAKPKAAQAPKAEAYGDTTYQYFWKNWGCTLTVSELGGIYNGATVTGYMKMVAQAVNGFTAENCASSNRSSTASTRAGGPEKATSGRPSEDRRSHSHVPGEPRVRRTRAASKISLAVGWSSRA